MRFRADLLLSGLALLAACGTASTVTSTPTGGTVGGVGILPEDVSPDNTATNPTSSTFDLVTSTIPAADTLGAIAPGNRILVIGDSILAATSRRYGDQMCAALTPLGWQVSVEAETSRFIDFGDDVLDERLDDGWDAAVIMLGNNYREDQPAFREDMIDLLDRLAPRPVLLVTVTEWMPSRRQVNEVIVELAAARPEVLVADWAALTAEDSPNANALLGADGLHLTERGRVEIAALIAGALGEAPAQPGRCLASEFEDDSGGPVDGTTTTTRPRTGGPTTTRPRSSTTSRPPTTPPASTTTTTGPPPTT